MSLTSALAIYFIIWWLTLFAVLPFGVRTQEEADSVVPGSAPSAPVAPMLGRKVLITTLVASVVFAIVWVLVVLKPIGLDDIPLLPRFDAH